MSRKRNCVSILILLFIILSITVGYAYLSSNLVMIGNVIVKKYDPPRYLYNEIMSQTKENGLMVLDNQASTYVSASMGIDFGAAPSDTNGKGVYVRNGTENDTYPVYYYRGNVTNNNVLFANYCWKMVRTTEIGGIKLIYNGNPKVEYETSPINKLNYTIITNDATYPYIYDESTKMWASTNKTHGTKSTITFSIAESGYYAMNYVVSSEIDEDRARFYLDDVELTSRYISGEQNGSIILGLITPSNIIKIEYEKDGSYSGGSDTVSFNIGISVGDVIKSCNNINVEQILGTSAYNISTEYNAYVGYMFGTPNSSEYKDEHANINNSTIKTYIDTWYNGNMINYTKYLEDTVWCNDRTVPEKYVSGNEKINGDGTGTSITYYGAYGRLKNDNPNPSLECVNKNDRFTVNEILNGRIDGNGALTYPVALLTADEIVLAGNGYYGYGNTYLTTGLYAWSMSPENLSNVFGVGFDGQFSSIYLSDSFNVRPSVSLAQGTTISKIGDGSVDSPFVVETN